jgi:hypothetical protein
MKAAVEKYIKTAVLEELMRVNDGGKSIKILIRSGAKDTQIKELLSQKELPVVFMATKDIKAKAKYTKPLGSYALSDWKLCHIQPVGFNTHTSIEDLEISDIEDHFRKYVNPNNMFVLPKEIGYLGEIDVFI